jgi:hypothetical protein
MKTGIDFIDNPAYVEITTERALKKWFPVIEALGVTDDRIKQIMAEYAEHDTSMLIGTIFGNNALLLPISMKILSKLNIKDKNVVFVGKEYWINKKRTELINKMLDDKEIHNEFKKEFSIKLPKDIIPLDEKTNEVSSFIRKGEGLLVQILIDHFNKELETKNTIYITRLAGSLTYKRENDDNVLVLTSLCEIE